MAKDPAFLFYPNDYMGGTMHLSRKIKGAYVDLMCLQFNMGKMTIDDIRTFLNTDFEECWFPIMHKFESDGNHYWNKRLQMEIERRRAYSESRRANRLNKVLSGDKTNHMSDLMSDPVSAHMETENENRTFSWL